MDSTTDGSVKSRFLDLLARGRAAEQTLLAQLSDAERAEVGTPEHWSAKDHIAHLAAWKGQSARILAAAVRGETPDPGPDETAYNAQIFEANRTRPWADVLTDADAAYSALVAGLAACADADLTAPDRFPWRNGRALQTVVFGNGYEHPVEHYTQFYLDHGDLARAAAAQQTAVETRGALFGKASAQYSYAIYNLGCFYAKTGQLAPALDAVREALTLTPDLRDWAGQDPDLVPLHDDPAFQALIAP